MKSLAFIQLRAVSSVDGQESNSNMNIEPLIDNDVFYDASDYGLDSAYETNSAKSYSSEENDTTDETDTTN